MISQKRCFMEIRAELLRMQRCSTLGGIFIPVIMGCFSQTLHKNSCRQFLCQFDLGCNLLSFSTRHCLDWPIHSLSFSEGFVQQEISGACLFSLCTTSCLQSSVFWRELHQSGNGGCPWERMAREEREHSNTCGSKSKDGEGWWEEMPSRQVKSCASPGIVGIVGKVHSWTRMWFNPIWNVLSNTSWG